MKRIAKRRRRFVLFVLLAMLLALNFCPVAASEGEQDADLAGNIEEILSELDTEELQKYLDSLTEEQRELFGDNIADAIRSVISGDFKLDYSNVFSAVAGLIFDGLKGMLPAFCVICSITILCGLLTHFRSSFAENGTAKLIHFVGYSAILVLILSSLAGVLGDCIAAVNSMRSQMQAIFPVLLTLIATSGGSVSVAVYQPAVLFLSEAVVGIITSAIFPLAGLIFVLNMVGNMSKEIKVKNFSAFFAGIIKWTLGITLAAFTVFLTVQGITSATYDGLSFKAAKYAISNSVPIIGGFLGSGFDLVIAGSVLIKNAVGSCGIALLVIVLAAPLIQLIVCNLFFKLTAAVTEPVGDSGISDFLSSVSGTINYFIAGLISVAFMYFITMLLLICSSNSLF
ncbi:MAG TPA: stage III sporulation protein AE [Candidatus Borkfalkia excrementipullorum]|nr:stage III sporulation protein AE [Candidatus Borkfalkia excrementipullorum]